MKTTAAALSIALLAGCSDSDSPPPPVFGGFEPQDQTAVIFAPTTCDILGAGTVSMAGVAVLFTDYVGACDVLGVVPYCGMRETSAEVIGLALSGVPGVATLGPAGPGTYPFLANAPTGAFLACTADAGKVGADCAAVEGGGNLDLVGGQMVLASVSDTAVTGSVDFRFDDGTAFAQAFDAPICPVTFDVCVLFEPCWEGYACAPAPAP